MKVLAIVLLLVMSSTITFAQAGENDAEKQFDMEEDTVQIHDLEAERTAAKEEALRQEKQERETKKELTKLESRKNQEAAVTKKVVLLYRDRILTAEKGRKNAEAQSAILNKEIQKMKMQVTASETKAKSSEGTAKEASNMVNDLKKQKGDLTKRETNAIRQTTALESQLRLLKIQYARLKMETQQLEGHLKMIEDVEAKREAERDKMNRDISSMKDRRKAADETIRAHQGSSN